MATAAVIPPVQVDGTLFRSVTRLLTVLCLRAASAMRRDAFIGVPFNCQLCLPSCRQCNLLTFFRRVVSQLSTVFCFRAASANRRGRSWSCPSILNCVCRCAASNLTKFIRRVCPSVVNCAPPFSCKCNLTGFVHRIALRIALEFVIELP